LTGAFEAVDRTGGSGGHPEHPSQLGRPAGLISDEQTLEREMVVDQARTRGHDIVGAQPYRVRGGRCSARVSRPAATTPPDYAFAVWAPIFVG
jgi:hypothetical protein